MPGGQPVGPVRPIAAAAGPQSVATATVEFAPSVWWIDTVGDLNAPGEVRKRMPVAPG